MTKSWLIGLLVCILTGCGGPSPANKVGNDFARAAPGPVRALAAASFFASGEHNEALLQAVRKGTESQINFAAHFSTSYVDCGTACGSYWIVDRRTGAVYEGPTDPAEDQMIWDIVTQPANGNLKAIYGPRNGAPVGCLSQEFRWTGEDLEKSSEVRPVACPD